MTEKPITNETLLEAWNLNKKQGFFEPFQKIGVNLSLDSALSTWSARAVREFRSSQARTTAAKALGFMDQRLENLAETRALIQTTIVDFDRKNLWDELSAIRKRFNAREMAEVLKGDFGLHGFPAVIESAVWNADYMLEHGVRSYYVYTDEYLGRVEANIRDAEDRFREEASSGQQVSAWLEMMDLVGIEVSIPCDTCRLGISFWLRLRELKA